MTADLDWPTMQEELSRKSLETLHHYMHAHSEGKLTDKGLILIVNVITDCTMGLVPKDVSDTIYQVRKALEPK